ncbi:MAG: hypothetical protein ACJAR2_002432 [Ilumatobacter sp.]|jgi:uncharacterized protein (DUF1501 family)
MLDPDISTADAMRHLHRPVDASSLDRRRFLQLVGMGMGAGALAGPGSSVLDALVPGHDPSAWAAGPIGAEDGVVVVIGMYGGNDGLNTVVPIDDGLYYDQHGALAIDPGDTLPLDSNTGLNPALTEFKRFWDAGQLAIVEGVGHAQDEFSHFSSMAKWMAGQTTGLPTSGWIGRWLDDYLGGEKDLYAAAEIGHSLPLHLIGNRSAATTVPVGQPRFGVPRDWRSEQDRAMFASIRDAAAPGGSPDMSTWLGRVGAAQIDQLDVAATLSPIIPESEQLPADQIVAKLEIAARLINANLGFRVLSAGFGDFDSHAGQPAQHPVRMRELNSAIQRFFSTLNAQWAGRVTVMTFSEFGRTPFANDGAGTDHGSSAPHFVLGAGVKGGFYGERPSLAGLQRWERMPTHVDLRDYYGSVLDGWLGGGAGDVMPGARTDLNLFANGPSAELNALPPVSPQSDFPSPGGRAEFVAMSPQRIYDSRNGIGGPAAAIGAGQTVKIQIAGEGGIPASGITAVAVNLTSIRPGANTFMTAYPTGQVRPESSTLNPRAGSVVPNMTIVGVGADGSISMFNNRSYVDLTVDVLGYFQLGNSDNSFSSLGRMLPLSPSRILDTRSGVGAPRARVHGGRRLSLQVLGRGGVPVSGVQAVVLNLLSVKPTGNGFVTAWPSGTQKPGTANLSFREGRNIPNLTMCKVGSDGRIHLESNAGQVDLVADVVGCFTNAGQQLSPVAPARLLDTRNGTGAPQQRVGAGQEVTLKVTGLAGVPAGARAVALNVSAVQPTHQTFLTVYPSGENRPEASSLNPDAGAVSANLVIAKVGGDGSVTIFNNRGDVDLLADVTAYFL